MISIPVTTIYIILILLPGFASSIIDRTLAFRPNETNFDKLIRAVFYTFIVHVIYGLTMGDFSPWIISNQNGNTIITVVHKCGLLYLFIIAIVIGCIAGILKTHDFHMKVARKLSISNRTSRSSLWQDVFSDKKGTYVFIHLKDGRRINGWPEYYNDSFAIGPVVFLSKAKWITNDSEIDIPNPGIMINSDEIQFIQFYIPTED